MKRESTAALVLVLALVLNGVFIVYSASIVGEDADARLIRLAIYVAGGLVAMFTAAHFDYHRLRDPALFRSIVGISISLLVLVLVPGIGDERNGARRWLEVGGFSFQPSEFAKFAVILLLAVKLSENREQIRSFFKGFLPPMFITIVFAALVLLEKDLGTPAVICATAFIMLFVAGTRRLFLLPGVIAAIGAIWALSVTSPHRLARLTAFLDPWSHRDTSGYQLIQSLAAITRGAVWGRGPGAGEQKLLYLPEAHTDFIFAVWAEEMGLVGSLVLLTLFFALICVSLRIAFHARDLFGTLLVSGITALVGLQAAVNMAVVSGMLPTKGLPLPFISWGGSSLMVFMGLMGIVISVGLRANRVEDRVARTPRANQVPRARAA